MIKPYIKNIIFFILFISSFQVNAQNLVELKGKIIDSEGNPVSEAHIRNMSNNTGVVSQKDGSYLLTIPAYRDVLIQVSCIGFETREFKINYEKDTIKKLNIVLNIL